MRSMTSLSREDAVQRSSHVRLEHMDVSVDLSRAYDPQEMTFPVTSVFTLESSSPELSIDAHAHVMSVLVNGATHPWDHEGEALRLTGLPVGTPMTIEVRALSDYSRTGEGLHRYVDPEDGRTYLYTQFEPADAHRAWPCLDQPDIKPRWTFHVTAPSEWLVISNGATARVEQATEGSSTHHFVTTPPLSSYITVLVAGEYACVEGGEWRGGYASGNDVDEVSIPLRVLCRRALAPHMDSDDILEVTRSGLDFFHARYSFTYPWGKYDQVFVPEYNLGAMENPGCVTFTESYLRRDTPTPAERQRRANTILHEMSHMWFGDLVTPAWWDDLWLKESFADHEGTLATAQATRYSQEWASFALARKAWAHEQDLLPTTHPIVADIPDVEAARTNFDGITYAKGAAVLKQLVAWVGEDKFVAAMRSYFRTYAFASTRLKDVLSCLEAVSDRDLKDWPNLWLQTTGPSLLWSTYTPDAEGNIRQFLLHQTALGKDPVCRPHHLVVSTWALCSAPCERDQNPRLERTHRFEVTLTGSSVPIDPDGALTYPRAVQDCSLIVVNDEDLTYAVTRLDADSRAFALRHLSLCEDPLTRAVLWSALWNEVRDASLNPREFVDAVLTHGPHEENEAVVRRLLACALTCVERYCPQEERPHVAMSMCRVAREQAQTHVYDNEGQRRAWIGLFAAASHYLETSEARDSHALWELAEGSLGGQKVDEVSAWAARTALAAHALVDVTRLDAWLARTPSGENAVRHTRALASQPDAKVRRLARHRVCGQDLSNEHLSATLEGLSCSTWTGQDDLSFFCDSVVTYWREHSMGMGIRFVRGAAPHTLTGQTTSKDLTDWLDSCGALPDQLMRLLEEWVDDVARTERIRAAWRHP